MCKIRALVSEMSSYTSVLTIVAFSMERYLAICHPLHSYAMSNLERAVKIIAFLWLLSLVSASPFAVFTTISYVDYPPGSGREVMESAFCAMMEQDIPEHWPIYEISSFLFFMLPMCVILVLYVLMGIKIRNRKDKSLCNRLSSVHSDQRSSDSRTRSIIRMLGKNEGSKKVGSNSERTVRQVLRFDLRNVHLFRVAASVVVAFFLCWAPFHAQRLIYLYGKDAPNYSEINEWMYYITGILYYFSSTVNPILYSVMSARYRVAFRKTICRCLRSPSAAGKVDDATSAYRDNNGLRYNGSVVSRGRSFVGRTSVVLDGVGGSASSYKPRPTVRRPNDEVLKLIDRTFAEEEAKKVVCFSDVPSDVVVVMEPASNGKARTMTAGSPYKDADDALKDAIASQDLEKNRETHI
ncbi:hypothetical protein PR048_019262 [Dryococelus australis]|uniref:G-protein coupled receptors family 1 profile domain-containing protein n=1 Tax=Dryococelus australis TaxID=614101 RepID=A0ABQ9H330_9NEOP|nr:hypothetical protein PR048_019262 [Dryococelus australis]